MFLRRLSISAAAIFALIAAAAADPVLEDATCFAVGPIGHNASMSDGERSLRATLGRPDAAAKLAEVVRSASPAAQLYALLGLRLSDRAAFARAFHSFARREDRVKAMAGCKRYDEQVRLIALNIAHGEYDEAIRRPPW